MILLKSNGEIKSTFEKLIKTMGANVDWTGLFVVIGDYLILEGRVRSLFFNFESRQVVTNLIELPIKQEDILELDAFPKVANAFNIVLYAFGKWGTIKGLKVEKNYAQLNALFAAVLKEFYIDPEYTMENFRFYKEGIRLNYEDVVQAIKAAKERLPDEPEEERESRQGLWHRLIWRKKRADFKQAEITFEEQQTERLGHNFYMVGYLCPLCGKKLHVIVFPVDREFRIETEEGPVLLARAYACDTCNCFYTPRPQKLLSEGDSYDMDFEDDKKAFDDYVELLGDHGSRESNYRFNEFEAVVKKGARPEDARKETLEKLFERIEEMPESEFEQLLQKVEEGFYPRESVKRYKTSIKEQEKKRKERKSRPKNREEKRTEKDIKACPGKETEAEHKHISGQIGAVYGGRKETGAGAVPGAQNQAERLPVSKEKEKRERARERYRAKLGILERLSQGQRQELQADIRRDPCLLDTEKEQYLDQIRQSEKKKKLESFRQKVKNCEGKSYEKIKKCLAELEREPLPGEEKKLLQRELLKMKREQGEREVRQLVEKRSPHMDFKAYQKLDEKLKAYTDVDKAPYEEVLKEGRRSAQRQEITNLVQRSRKNTRQDYEELMNRLQESGFDPKDSKPYLDKVKEQVKKIDENAIEAICKNMQQMDFEEASKALQKIKDGLFLPKLKTNALEMLTKRLAKIKTDECELLVRKLKEELEGNRLVNDRIHFYPARRVLMKEASKEEMSVIDCAISVYGHQRGEFEYPILVVDSSRNGNGKEGMILTPDHVFCNSFLNTYEIPVPTITKIRASTGLLNRGVFMELKNGTKVKLPYVLEHRELARWANILDQFIAYLKEKPESRKPAYLAKEKHETICCFRCGYVYKSGNVCPKCGYKSNQ